MSDDAATHEYLVLSRGQWNESASKHDVEQAIERFYAWYERCVASGSIKPGHRLSTEGRIVSAGGVTDGPFAEAKELVGGYWIIVARSLDEAAALAAENPCVAHGLTFEIRPLEHVRASAFRPANETPAAWGAP